MGTAILRSRDCLQRRILSNDALSLPSSQIRSRKNSNLNTNFKTNVTNQNRCRKHSPAETGHEKQHERRQSTERTVKPSKLVTKQIKILKRGEKLSSEIIPDAGVVVPEEDRRVKAVEIDLDLNNPDLLSGSTDRFVSDSITIQNQVRVSESKVGIYAGFTFVDSPPPSSVPVPRFLAKKGFATTDLRRLLRLEF